MKRFELNICAQYKAFDLKNVGTVASGEWFEEQRPIEEILVHQDCDQSKFIIVKLITIYM